MEPLPYTLQTPLIDEQDVEQEAHLYSLTHDGKKPSKKIIRQKLLLDAPGQIFSGDISSIGVKVSQGPGVNLRAIQTLVEWAVDQSQEILDLILNFLDDPENNLQLTLKELARHQVVLHTIIPQQSSSLIQAVHRHLTQHPEWHEIEKLYGWVRAIHRAKRPEASLRQALRRLIEQGQIEKSGTSYRIKKEN